MSEPEAPRGARSAGLDISIVIVTWNSGSNFARLYPTLRDSLTAIPELRSRIVVVDNGSGDGGPGPIVDDDVLLVNNNHNAGFSPAANQGIRATDSTYVALLNDDTECDRDWLAVLFDELEHAPRVGAAGALLVYRHDPGTVNSAGIGLDLLGRARDLHDGDPVSGLGLDTRPVFGASAGAVLLRRSMLDEIGLLAEGHFAYYEDVDLAWRARRAGWGAVVVPRAVVVHEHSASAGRIPGFKDRMSARNMVWTLTANASVPHLVAAAIGQVLLLPWTLVLAVVRRDGSALRGLVDGIRGTPAVWRQRHGRYLALSAFETPRLLGYRAATRRRARSAR